MFAGIAIFILPAVFIAAMVFLSLPRGTKPYALFVLLSVVAGWLASVVAADISSEPVSELTVFFAVIVCLATVVLPLLLQQDLTGPKNDHNSEQISGRD